MEPGLQGLEERYLVLERAEPVWVLEEADRIAGHLFCSPPVVVEVIVSWVAGIWVCLAENA